jgi:hypothetical protein
MALPPPGTFRLYPYAEPPLPAGRYTLSGDVTAMPGAVESLSTTVDVVSPRYALPPDQILGTFPPAGARGTFTSRLPQIVLRRRTLPWERSGDLFGAGTPTPWLALVLIAENEGRLLTDVPVEQCVTDGVTLGADRDVPKGACLEVPERVVTATFPTREDLALLTHLREVDISDTELAMGDDDGWMAVVLGNRLPQANTRYLACLINLEGQYSELPEVADVELELEYNRFAAIVDLSAIAGATLGSGTTVDRVVMGLPGARPIDAPVVADFGAGPAAAAAAPPAAAPKTGAAPKTAAAVRGATGAAPPTGAGWSATVRPEANSPAAAAAHAAIGGDAGRLALADGFAYPAGLLFERVLRFPALAYWSFTCEERGDFQYLAEHVNARLLGHVPDPAHPDTPDGDPLPDGATAPAPGARPEPVKPRPLPIVAETGHVSLAAVTRRGDPAEAWFRGPFAPTPVERADTRADGDARPPLAHHADQLRRVVPDGHEDLGYASAFEIGRLLALNQPGIAAALARWRHDAFGAAAVRSATTEAIASAPGPFLDRTRQPDPLTDDTAERVRAGGIGRRSVRAMFELLGGSPQAIAPARPLADPGVATRVLPQLAERQRDAAIVAGLGIERGLAGVDLSDAAATAAALGTIGAQVAGERNPATETTVLRRTLESEAGHVADSAAGAARIDRFGGGGSGGRT